MIQPSNLQQLFENPSPAVVDLLLDLCSEFPGIVFAMNASGKILFSGGKDHAALPWDPRETVGGDYRQLLAGHAQALDEVQRALAGEAFEIKSEFLGRYYETRYAPVRRGSLMLGFIGIAHDVTAQRRIEQELQTHQTLYRTVIETTDTGFVMLDNQGLVVDANEEYLRMTGFSSLAEIQGHRVTEWTAPHDIERNREEVEKCLRLGMTRNLRIDYLDQQGRIVPIEVNATYIYVDGQPRILALCRDVHARLEAEAQLRRHERLSEGILASIPDAVVVLDPNGTIQAVNEGWRRFVRQFSFADEDTLGPGSDYLDIFRRAVAEGAQVASTCAAGIRDVLARKKQRHEQEFSVGQGRQRRWFLKRATRLLQEDGAVVVTHVEVTERRAAQVAIEDSERRFRTLVELAPVGVFEADARGQCQYVNAAWCRLYGLSPEQALGQGWAEAVHSEDRPRVLEEWERLASRGEPSAAEYRICTPAGVVSWVQGRAVPLRDDSGQVTGYIGTIMDISAHKRVELQREARTRLLEQAVAETPARNGAPAPALERDARSGAYTGRALRRWLVESWSATPGSASSAVLRMELDGPAALEGGTLDELVHSVARLASGLLRSCDLVGRQGPSGFLIVLTCSNASGARACAERLRAGIERAVWGTPLSVSIGIAPRTSATRGPEALLESAEVALATARASGGNRAVLREELAERA